jgi:cell division protein FtsA
MQSHFSPPRMKPLSPRRSATYAILDVGTSKIICLIARLTPVREIAAGDWRTHRARVIGIGQCRAQGMKNGIVVDMAEVERSIRQAVDAAERMCGAQADYVIVASAGGRLASENYSASTQIGGKEVAATDIHCILETAAAQALPHSRVALHMRPTGFSLDGVSGVRDPRAMIGEELGAKLHVAACDQTAARNLVLAVERGHLGVEAIVAAPYAAGLSVLEQDEAEMGVVSIDMGAGTTTLTVLERGEMVHIDAVTLGGALVTMDIARGLDARLADAERLKIFHGSAIAAATDEREAVVFEQVGDRGVHRTQTSKAQLVRIIRPRIEETFEFLRDRLARAGFQSGPGRRVVLTGGASQLKGVLETSRRILGGQARIGRPIGIEGLPEAAATPAFAAAAGLLVYPQVADREYFAAGRVSVPATGNGNYVTRVSRWLREGF